MVEPPAFLVSGLGVENGVVVNPGLRKYDGRYDRLVAGHALPDAKTMCNGRPVYYKSEDLQVVVGRSVLGQIMYWLPGSGWRFHSSGDQTSPARDFPWTTDDSCDGSGYWTCPMNGCTVVPLRESP